MKRLHSLATALALMFFASYAGAHTDDYLDTQKSSHGGQQRAAGPYHLELVVSKDSQETRDNPLVVHITDHAGAKVPTAGVSGTATVLIGKHKQVATLAPDGDNRLKGSAAYASAADMKVVVAISFPGKAVEQARFTPLAKPAAKPAAKTAAKHDHSGH